MARFGVSELMVLNVIFFIIFLIPLIFFLLTMQNTLHAISNENRKVEPGKVWLSLIPLFGFAWQFIMVTQTADSLKAEFEKLNIKVNELRPGAGIGLTYSILLCCSILPFLGALTFLAGIICLIIYWVKINGYKALLIQNKINTK